MAITTKHGSVVVGGIFFIAAIVAGTFIGVETMQYSYRFQPEMWMVEITFMIIGIFSVLMAVGAVIEHPTMMFPWLAVLLTGLLGGTLIDVFMIICSAGHPYPSGMLPIIGGLTGSIVLVSLFWAIVYHRYHQIIAPKTTKTLPANPLDNEHKGMLTYHRFKNDITA